MFDRAVKNEITAIANAHDIEPEALMAVVEVESAGKMGAMVNGRMEPLIRFEGHYFYRLLPNAKRNIAVAKGLAHSRAGKIRNPLRQTSRWKFLTRAKAIDRSAALASCSWGCGQVMGAHWRWLGYASIDALVTEARDGDAGQVRLMMRYIDKAKLVEKLNAHDWAGFARAYNGPAYRKNRYDKKMRDAYLRFKNLNRSDEKRLRFNTRHHLQMLRFGSRGVAVKQLQRDLSSLGYRLSVDGDFGPATERVLEQFQRENRLKADGIFGPKTLEMLTRKLPVTA